MVYQQVCRMVADISGVDETLITPNTRLDRGNGIDAIGFAKLIIRCECKFHITINDEDASDFLYVSDLTRYIGECLRDGDNEYRMPSDADRTAWYYE